MRFSRTLAIIFGTLTPILETVRRWSNWRDDPPMLFDDYIMGMFLLLGAWVTRRESAHGRALLAAAWGFTCGLAYYSVFGQLRHMRLGELDPAPIPSVCVLWIKIVGASLALIAMLLTVSRARAGKASLQQVEKQ